MRTGGVFLAQGADTCVYDPPIECVPGTQTPSVLPPGSYVSRITPKDPTGDELVNQTEVKSAIQRVQQKYPDVEIESLFNVAVATCTPVFKKTDLLRAPRYQGDVPAPCRANDNTIDTEGEKPDKINFITPKQNEDLSRSQRPKDITIQALRKLFHAVVYLNNENVIHTDAHFGNIAWMGDRLVMHDWGRAAIGIKGFKNFMKKYGLLHKSDRERLGKLFKQYAKPCELLETCPIKLSDDATSHRFMKIYDVLSMAGSLSHNALANRKAVDEFGRDMEALWKNKDIPTNQMMPVVHKYIDDLFDAPLQVAAPLPVAAPEITPLPGSSDDQWFDWIMSHIEQQMDLVLRDRPGMDKKITARLVSIKGPLAVFELQPEMKLKLDEAQYRTVLNERQVAIPEVFMMKDGRKDKLFVPIQMFKDDEVIIHEHVYSSLSMTPGGARKLNQTQRFCKCIKKVRKTVKNEKGPIAICVSSVLQTRGRTLKRFTCGKKGRVITQKAKH